MKKGIWSSFASTALNREAAPVKLEMPVTTTTPSNIRGLKSTAFLLRNTAPIPAPLMRSVRKLREAAQDHEAAQLKLSVRPSLDKGVPVFHHEPMAAVLAEQTWFLRTCTRAIIREDNGHFTMSLFAARLIPVERVRLGGKCPASRVVAAQA
jgi:hypothetical protein